MPHNVGNETSDAASFLSFVDSSFSRISNLISLHRIIDKCGIGYLFGWV